MANEPSNSNTVSKDNAGFPGYLDFNALRTSSIKYLSGLTGKVWTDYNVHDPGITILEVLIYAMLDLGYRTNLPAIDIFSKNTLEGNNEDNFFTPAEILACNPLTITDCRKLLIDIEGVRNAWLTVAEDVSTHTICNTKPVDGTGFADGRQSVAAPFLNGLYHVAIELEDEQVRAAHCVMADVKAALQAHRNLCEDFFDIAILCWLDIGICADLALEANAVADDVYKEIITRLHDFFSPAPKFYTLQQLLDKQKPIEDIFAGRPMGKNKSFGFVDTDEFENIKQKTSIHLSDVYNILLNINGVKTARKLSLTTNGKDFSSVWEFALPDKYLPRLSLDISSFQFTANGTPVPFSRQKGQGWLQLAASANKIIQPPESLDAGFPEGGVYHNDLADYYSIQNDFPLVYGIGEGGLPATASPMRKAQALQLKGYLLFFDQLLANYLSQLNNLRSLFSFQPPVDKSKRQTYFLNNLDTLKTVPGLAQLIGANNVADGEAPGNTSVKGSILAYPVKKSAFDALLNKGNFTSNDITQLQQTFACTTRDEYLVIASMLQDDFSNGLAVIANPIATTDNDYFYYVTSSTESVVLIGTFFCKKEEVLDAAQLLLSVASLPQSYSSYFTSDGFGFTIQLNLPTYMEYLQQITEGNAEYRKRRTLFLNHLLSRFAEQFTDFALLFYTSLEKNELADKGIQHAENFLLQYPSLSSNRARAFDYTQTAVNGQSNTSGFEERFKAYAGIDTAAGKSLCNFEVARHDDDYAIKLRIAGFHLFNVPARNEGEGKAQQILQQLVVALGIAGNYQLVPAANGKYQLQVKHAENKFAYYPQALIKNDAEQVIGSLQKMFNNEVSNESIFVNRYQYWLQLKNYAGKIIRVSAESFTTKEQAFAEAAANIKMPNDKLKWQLISPEDTPSNRLRKKINKPEDENEHEEYLDIDAFKVEINNILGKPNKYDYELLDQENSFKFKSLNEFSNAAQARADCARLLVLMINTDAYLLANEGGAYKFYIVDNGRSVAECLNRMDTEELANEFRGYVCDTVKKHYYYLSLQAIALTWKFRYQLGFIQAAVLLFESDAGFENESDARQAAENFSSQLPAAQLQVINGKFSITLPGNAAATLTCTYAGNEIINETEDVKMATVNNIFALSQQIKQYLQSGGTMPFNIDALDNNEVYIYKLVDKNNLLAFNTVNAIDSILQVDALYGQAMEGYPVLDISMAGKNTEQVSGKNTETFYRYIIRCQRSNSEFKKDDILFKSVAVFNTVTDAEKAFIENYLWVLSKASDISNYGPGKAVSLVETLPDISIMQAANQPLLFVPNQIIASQNGDEAKAKRLLAAAAISYPIKIVEADTEALYKLYPHERPVVEKGCMAPIAQQDCAVAIPKKWKYYFVLYNMQTSKADWQSVKLYDKPSAATQDFYFFQMLLSYKGNYFIDADKGCDKQTIFIREVLAESTARFSEEAAWGKEGIGKFICYAQSQNAFHNFINNSTGAYNFYVSCDEENAIHPCKYDSATERDTAIEKLRAAFESVKDKKLFELITIAGADDTALINGMDDTPLVVLTKENGSLFTCSTIGVLLNLVAIDANYKILPDNKFSIEFKEGDFIKIAKPFNENMSIADWKRRLIELSYYYPIRETADQKFSVEIKFPQFNGPESTGDACYIAWKAGCSFNKCEDAMSSYKRIIALLADTNNYQSFFDCGCYSFGIGLQGPASIVAYNPQRYTTPDMACEAIERSKKLIDCEGLRLVEHILLRPRCEDDKICKSLKPFTDNISCNDWLWKETDFIDGEEMDNQMPFVPGADPFSFIATIILPAWPKRFRNTANRELVETMLNREAPAHVLLRILWLAPGDTCTFETLYKEWASWLSKNDDGCNKEAAAFNLATFIFDTALHCMPACTDCLPCTAVAEPVMPDCLKETSGNSTKSAANFKRLTDINELFGWSKYNCGETGTQAASVNIANDTLIINEPILLINSAVMPAFPVFTQMSQDEAAELNRRMGRYKSFIESLPLDASDTLLSGGTLNILGGKIPTKDMDKINEKIIGLLQNEGGENIQLSSIQKDGLIKNVFFAYLDKVVFKENDPSKINLLAASITVLQQAGFNMQQLFEEWNAEEITAYQPNIDMESVRQLLIKN